MIARLWQWLAGAFSPPDHAPALGALMADMQGQQQAAMGLGPGWLHLCQGGAPVDPGRHYTPLESWALMHVGVIPEPDAFIFDGAAMAHRLTLTLPLDLAAWIAAERGTATREEFALGRLYIAKIVGDLQHSDIRSMQEAMRTHGVAAALRKAPDGH